MINPAAENPVPDLFPARTARFWAFCRASCAFSVNRLMSMTNDLCERAPLRVAAKQIGAERRSETADL